ncbi:DNA-binding transcriptional regulator MelR [compost metagenome]
MTTMQKISSNFRADFLLFRFMTKLYIKNMVCNRCKMVVGDVMASLGFSVSQMELGEVTVEETVEDKKEALKEALEQLGFELIDDKKSRVIEKVKNLIIDLVHHKSEALQTNLSDYLSAVLHQDYAGISNLFSEVEGITIEKYLIAQKIEKVKELLIYDELSLSEIAWQLNYSSVAHLSSQFKKVTGMTPSYFKSLQGNRRKPLDKVG